PAEFKGAQENHRSMPSRGPIASGPATATAATTTAAKAGRRRVLPWGLLGMLGLVVAIESFVARDLLDFSDPVSLSWRLAARWAAHAAPGRPVRSAGDSLIKPGLIPRVIPARSGLAATNLAIARGPAPATFFLIRRAFDSGARPAALVVDFKPNVLAGG